MTSNQGRNKQAKKLKIACLHGFGTNKQFMKMQTLSLVKQLNDIAQFIFVDGPYVIPYQFVTDPKVINNLQAPPRAWFSWKLVSKTSSAQQKKRNLEDISKAIQNSSPYIDGVLGFSNGSQAFQLLAWKHAQGFINCKFMDKLKFFINYSADSMTISLKQLHGKRFTIPSLHFLSQEDFLFNKCILTPILYQNPQIIFHTYGHRFPFLGLIQKRKMKNFLYTHGFQKKKQNGIELNSKL